MSKNSNEKQLNSRLSNIFSDIDKPNNFPGLDATSDLTGWIWEIDPRGMITGCSPEIEAFLEIPAAHLIGKPISSFSDLNLETAKLPSDPNLAMMPTAVQVNFTREDGSPLSTDCFIMAKLDDDGDIISWRGITSVISIEEIEAGQPDEPQEEDESSLRALATLDIVPEVPQPDMTVSDIWRKSSLDTAPLSMEDALEESRAFQSALENQSQPPAAADELKTFIVRREPEEEAEDHSPNQEEQAEEPVEITPSEMTTEDPVQAQAPFGLFEEGQPAEQPLEADFQDSGDSVDENSFWDAEPTMMPAPESDPLEGMYSIGAEPGAEDPEEVDSEILQSFSTIEPSAYVEGQPVFPQEHDQDTASNMDTAGLPSLESVEAAARETKAAEPAAMENPVQPAEFTTSPQDEIETIRYPRQVFEERMAEHAQPTGEQEASDPGTSQQDVPEEEDEVFTPEFKTSPSFEPAVAAPAAFDEAAPKIDSTTSNQPAVELESAFPTESVEEPDSDWVPEFKSPGMHTPRWAEEDFEEFIDKPTSADDEVPTKPLELKALGFDLATPKGEDNQSPALLDLADESNQQESTQIEPESGMGDLLEMEAQSIIDAWGQEPTTTDIETPLGIEEMEADSHVPADTKELNPTAHQPRPPAAEEDRPWSTDSPTDAQPDAQAEKIKSWHDLDFQQEEVEEPEEPAETETLEPFPKPPVTGPARRPLIDTGSLIPSLMRASRELEDKPETEEFEDIFLKDLSEDTVRVETKELDSHTSGDGTHLTISRGVQELLKIVDDNPNRTWKEDELRLVEQVHTQLELALENANLFQQTQLALAETDERARQLRLLNQMSDKINQTENLIEIYQIVADITKEIFRVELATVTTITDDRRTLEIAAAAGREANFPIGSTLPIEDTPNEVVVRENRVFIPKELTGLDFGEIKSILAGPISVSSAVIGTLNVGSVHANAFNDRDANFLAQVLSLLNASVENRRLFEQIESALSATEEQARRLAELNRLSEHLSSTTSIDSVVNLVIGSLNRIIPADDWAFASINDTAQTYTLHLSEERRSARPHIDGQAINLQQPLEDSIIGKAANQRRTITEFNCRDSSYNDVRLWSDQNGIRTVMATPILVGTKPIGVLTIGSKQLSAYTVQEENILLSVASLAGATIDNRQLMTQIQKRSQQLETSAEVSRVASTMLDPTELLPRVAELIKEGFNLYYAGIFLVDETGELTGESGKWAVLRAGSGEPGKQMLASGHKLEIGGESMIGTAVASSQARIALNVGDEASFFRNPYLPNTQSEMALPLTSRGQVLGALSIQSEIEDAFSQEDITALQTMADQLANAIENARLFEQTELRAEELTVLNEMARGFSQSMVIDDLIQNTYEYTSRLMNANNFSMVLYYPEEQFYEFRLLVEAQQQITPAQQRVRLGNGLTDWIIKNKLPVLMPSNPMNHLEALGVEPLEHMPKSWLGVPMLLGNQVTGVIAVQNFNQEHVYNNHSLDLLIAVSSQAAVAIDNARRFQATQTRARYEEILRRVTTQVHSTSDPDAILRTAVREASDAIGKPAFVQLSPSAKSGGSKPSKTSTAENAPYPTPAPPSGLQIPNESEER